MDYYEILGIPKTASPDEIKRAYRRLALKHHPDRGGDSGEFKKMSEAYQILSDPQRRAQYDRFGKAGVGGQGAGGFDYSGFSSRGGQAGWDFGDSGTQGFEFSFGGGGLGDIFGDFFTQAFSTIQAEVEITPAQAVLGDKMAIEIGGDKTDFDIPPGTQDGQQFRFRGKGRAVKGGGRGDLIIAVRVKIPSNPTKEQKELWEGLRQSERVKKGWWRR